MVKVRERGGVILSIWSRYSVIKVAMISEQVMDNTGVKWLSPDDIRDGVEKQAAQESKNILMFFLIDRKHYCGFE